MTRVADGFGADDGIDFSRPNAARMYDFMLGGAHNFATDRRQVAKVIENRPDAVRAVWETRSYLRRVVQWCAEAGLDQFLDLGSGVPTVGNVHEIARVTTPSVRVAYVDYEPVAVAHASEIVADLDTVTITRADLRDHEAVLAAPGVASLIDFGRPVALLALSVLHFVPGDIVGVLGRYRAELAPGSVVAITHGSEDQDDPAVGADMRAMIEAYRGTANEATSRSRADLYALLDGLEIVEPGLVDIVDWPHARPDTARVGTYGAVARVP